MALSSFDINNPRLSCDHTFTSVLWKYIGHEPLEQEHFLQMNIKTALEHIVFGCGFTSGWRSLQATGENVQASLSDEEDNDLVDFRNALARAFRVPEDMVDTYVTFSGDSSTRVENLRLFMYAANDYLRDQKRATKPNTPSVSRNGTTISIAPPVTPVKIPIGINRPIGDDVKIESFDEMLYGANVKERDNPLANFTAELFKLLNEDGVNMLAKRGHDILDKLREDAEAKVIGNPITLNNFVKQIGDSLRGLPKLPQEVTFTVTLKM